MIRKKIVICGGHLTPALALIEEIEKKKNIEIIFFGRKIATEGSSNYSAEYRIISAKKIKFFTLVAGRIQRKFTKYTLTSLVKIPIGFIQSFLYLLLLRPNLIVSFWGYLSTPVIFCGWLLGIESITHEQAIIPGFATKANSLFVKKVFVSWKETAKFFDSRKVEVVGNLVRQSIFQKHPKSPKIAEFLKRSKNLIFIAGGNQGSHFLNNLIFHSLDLFKEYFLLHQVGTANFKGDYQRAQEIKNKNYMSCDYIDPDDFGAIASKAKAVICRSGANTVWELALLSKPAILIPLPLSSGNEQLENARILERAGFAKVSSQSKLSTKELTSKIKDIFNNYKNYRKKAHTFSKILQKDANFKVSAYIDHLLGYSERENPGIYAGGENESREAKEENTTAFRQ